MKKAFLLIPLVLSILLSSCGTEVIPETIQPETTAATSATTETTMPPATEPLHSDLYIPGLSAEDVIRYFGEVCLDAEFTNSGDSSVLQKWDTPIYYCLQGNSTEEDLAVLADFTQWLNSIPGFPGISETENPLEANLDFHFCTQEEMILVLGDWCYGLDGAVTFWYDDNRIHTAIIFIRTDLNQTLRNSVILEELYNGLGPIQDTSLRADSIIYAGYSEPQDLTEIDRLILQLLYNPDLLCGMDAEACAEVIRQLYY